MSRHSYFSITYGGTELYPDHIYDWKASGVNCSTEDYSVGSVNDIMLTFVTDIQPTKVSGEYQRVTVEGSPATSVYFRVRSVTKNAGQNRWTVDCSSEYDELDQPLPASYATPVANETAWQLFCRLQGVSAVNPPSLPNKDYVINPNWYSKGMTYRQAYSYLSQLMGMNIGAFLKTADTVGDMSNKFNPTTPDSQESNVLKFTPDNVKEIEIADYTVPTIKGVWVESNNPDIPYYQYGSSNPYESLILPFNLMANADTFAEDLYDQVTLLQAYTPMTLTTWTDAHIPNSLGADSQISTMVWWTRQYKWMKYTDANNNVYYCPIFSWELSPSGLSLQGTGNPQRQYDSGYAFEQAVNSKIDEINDNINNIFLAWNYPQANTYTYDVPAGMYLVTTAQYGANSTASDGMWLVRVSSSYHHYSPILTPADGTSVSAGLNQITVTRGSVRTTVCITRLGG